MDLTPRLLKIAQEIRPKEKVGDIGTDHGYLPIYLIKNHIAIEVIATDINEEPLNAAVKNIKNHGLQDYIKTKLGPGTIPLEEENLDVVIIAGMGGKLIAEILKNSNQLKKNVDRLILQPMQQQSELRRYLSEEGYCIDKDLLVEEGRRIYEILVVSLRQKQAPKSAVWTCADQGNDNTREIKKNHPKGYDLYQELEMELGFKLFNNPSFLVEKFLDQKINQMKKIIKETKGGTSEAALLMNERAQDKRKKLEEVKKCL